jgi:hypothetical protein
MQALAGLLLQGAALQVALFTLINFSSSLY